MNTEKRAFEHFLNILVILGSIFIIVIVSIELLSPRAILSEQFVLRTHLLVCIIFLLDFFVRWFYSGQGWRFMWQNLFFLLVSIPYLNLVYAFTPTVSHTTWVFLRLIPLARGIYGVSLIVSWMTRNKVTNLFITYLAILFIIVYFCSIMFYFVEHGPNPLVKDYWDALNWSLMNVTTVGSNIFGVTKFGQTLAVVLAASGMVFFPIFTAWVTTKFQNKRKEVSDIKPQNSEH